MTMRALFAAAVAVGALAGTSAFAGSPYYDHPETTAPMRDTVTSAPQPINGDYSAIAGDDVTVAAPVATTTAKPAASAAPPAVVVTAPPEMFSKATGYNGSP